ncbi:MAG: ABC transporter permease, partial [Gemmatimonadota bacterium]|nr:ABC transporter permease [Gemmatimonadota bacterium]
EVISLKRYQRPSLLHPFGTDQNDRDVFSRVLKGMQVSLGIAGAAVTVTLLLGTAYGTLAAMSSSWLEPLLMRIIDVGLSVPRLLILLAFAAFWDTLTFFELALLLGFTGWFEVARVTRGEVAGLLQRDFVIATKAIGVSRTRLAMQHIFPHLIPILVVMATLAIGNTIAVEASLMYLGAGMPLSTVSLGTILQDGIGKMQYWWITLFPGAAIVLIVLACNALGDALRNGFEQTQDAT